MTRRLSAPFPAVGAAVWILQVLLAIALVAALGLAIVLLVLLSLASWGLVAVGRV